jgi:hypothetical protein
MMMMENRNQGIIVIDEFLGRSYTYNMIISIQIIIHNVISTQNLGLMIVKVHTSEK